MSFGHNFKKSHFPASDNTFVPVNHGSFGLPPQCVVDEYVKRFNLDIASPDTFIRITQPKEYLQALKATAEVLKCSYKRLAFVDNATSGVNTVLRSYPFQKGDKIVMPSTTYGACANTVRFLQLTLGVDFEVVELEFPLENGEIVAAFRNVFSKSKTTMALFDTVVSMPGVKLPYQELTELCREFGVLSMVDGAHSIGLIPMDLSELKPDFYTSNLHKWLYLPRGCAVLYVDPKHFRTIQTMPVSHSYVDKDAELTEEQLDNLLVSKFTFYGSKCFSAIACVETAIKFRQDQCGGEEAIQNYGESLARQVGALTEKLWPGSSVIENKEGTLVTAMVTVFVPIEEMAPDFNPKDPKAVAEFIEFVSRHQIEKFNTFVPFGEHAGRMLVRFSCQTYNELSDFEYAIGAARKSAQAFFDEGRLARL